MRYGSGSHLLISISKSLVVKPIVMFKRTLGTNWHQSKRNVSFCSGEMGFYLWDPQSKKVLCSSDVYFNEDKMHKRPIKTIEIRRVIFQEDGQVHNRQLDNAPIACERREEPQE